MRRAESPGIPRRSRILQAMGGLNSFGLPIDEQAPSVLLAGASGLPRERLIHAMEQFGRIPRAVDNGASAMDELDHRPYRGVVVLGPLPDTDSLALCCRVASRERTTRRPGLILIDASLPRLDRLGAYALGVDLVLQEAGAAPRVLAARIESVLRRLSMPAAV